jgi:hypothetical protein
MFRPAPAVLFTVVTLATGSGMTRGEEPRTTTPQDVFAQRIMPIFKSPQPASCVQCHLAGVDLKSYILPSHEQTFASLRDQGMIDLADPKKSKILALIAMGDTDPDRGARLIHEKTRKAEYEALEAWITACCSDPKLRHLPRLHRTQLAKPQRPDEVLRHARKSRVVDSFERNVWSQRMRCFPCHTPHELDPQNPQHKLAIEKHKGFLERDDGAYADRMVLFRETPEATVQYLIEKSRRGAASGELPLINVKDPAKSLLVLKPTSRLPQRKPDGGFEPSYVMPVSHLGGLKMHVDDQSYKAFVAWIQDYANVVGDRYTSVADLPVDNWHPTRHAVILRDVPEAWPDGARVQFFVHARTAKDGAWESKPVAFTQALLNPRRNAAGMLFLFGPVRPADGQEAEPMQAEDAGLTPGRYLIKVYFDRGGRLKDDPSAFLGQADYAGQVEILANWGEGYPQAEAISGELMK